MVKVAIYNQAQAPLELADVDLEGPRTGEVQVRIVASGVCHSDLSVQNGAFAIEPPMILGHEGAGVVEAVGAEVAGFEEGDHVVTTVVPQCGECFQCQRGQSQLCEPGFLAQAIGGMLDGTYRFSRDGKPIKQLSVTGTFAQRTTLPATSLVKVPADLPLDRLCLLGCGVLTGVGAAINTAQIRPGDSVAVIGCGGVGLSAIQGARISGASQIIAVDMLPAKLELARQVGATDLVDASSLPAVEAVRALTPMTALGPRGVDYAFEVVGSAKVLVQATEMVRRGGVVVQVGVPPMSETLDDYPPFNLFLGSIDIRTSMYGGASIRHGVEMLVDLYRGGLLELEPLVSQEIGLEDVNQALRDLDAGVVARSVITSF